MIQITQSGLSIAAAAFVFSITAACGLPLAEEAMPESASSIEDALVSSPVLGAAARFEVLGSSTVTCTNAAFVRGDVGVAPGSSITGFNPGCGLTGGLHANDGVAVAAHAALNTTYNALAGAACTTNLTGRDLGGMTLAPGVYCFDSSAFLSGQLRLDGKGKSDAKWNFQIASTLTTATGASVVMVNKGQPCNVYWQVGSSATLGTSTAFKGNLITYSSITLVGGTNVIGRVLALNGAVTMDRNEISLGTCQSQSSKPPKH